VSLFAGLVEFVVVCVATAFVTTAIKEDEDERLWQATARLLGLMAGGIALFGLAVQFFTWQAS